MLAKEWSVRSVYFIMMLKVWIFAIAFPVGVFADFAADCAAINGIGDKKTFMYKGNCFIAHSTTVDFSIARDSCNDFPHGGHLAFIPTMDAYTTVSNAFPGAKHHIGLKHAGTADIKKDWWWIGPNGEQIEALADFTPWFTASNEPDSALGSNGYIYSNYAGGITDGVYTIGYVCEYEHSNRRHQYKEVKGSGRMPQSSSVIANHTGLIHGTMCAIICGKSVFCRSYAYKENTGECLIAPLLVGDIQNFVLSSDYVNFDKLY